jgi:Flp pilus assembly protein TadG
MERLQMRPIWKWKTALRDESGQVLVITALSMTALLGITALAVDVGLLFRSKRNIQIAADAAATAGALDYFNTSSSSSVITAAQNAAIANGYTDGSGGVTVTVTNPVTSGAHTGAGTVKVAITRSSPTVFMRILGRNSITVGAKAVAGAVSGPCIYLMNSSGTGLSISGNTTIEGINKDTGAVATGCGIYVRSNVSVNGGSNLIKMAYVAASGTITGGQNTNPAPVITGAPVEGVPNKLNIAVPAPTSSTFGGACGLPSGATSRTNQGVTTYTATITSMSAKTCYGIGSLSPTTNVLNLTLGSGVNLTGGIYGFNLGTAPTGPHSAGGTLTIGNGVTGSGITLDVYTGNLTVTSTSTTSLSAFTGTGTPPNGAVAGVVLLEPSTNSETIDIQWGNATGQFIGIIDAPAASVSLQDNGGSALVTGIVAGSLNLGPSTLKLKNYSDYYANSPLLSVALVE